MRILACVWPVRMGLLFCLFAAADPAKAAPEPERSGVPIDPEVAPAAPHAAERSARKTALEQRKAVLLARQREIEARVLRSEALARLRFNIERAKEERNRMRPMNSASFELRLKERSASRELDDLVAARLNTSEEAAQIERDRQALDLLWNPLRFQAGLAALKLRHQTQKVQAQVDADIEVKRRAEDVETALKNIRENPSAEAAAAREALSRILEKLTPMELRLKDNARLQVLAEAEQAAQGSIRDAERKDPRRPEAEKARRAYLAARQEALAKMPEAKPFLQELEPAEKAKPEVEGRRRSLRRILDAHRVAARAGSLPAVTAAREAVEATKVAYDNCLSSTGVLAALKSRVDAAAKACDRQQEEINSTSAAHRDLAKRIMEKEAQAAELEARALKTASGNLLVELASELEQTRREIEVASSQQREIRLRDREDSLEKMQTARGRAERALRDRVGDVPAAAEAARNVAAAEQALKQAVETALADSKEYSAATEKLRELDLENLRIEQQIAVAKYHLESDLSTIHPAVEADPTVTGLRDAWRFLEREIQMNPVRVSDFVRQVHLDARNAYLNALEQTKEKGYDEAVAARGKAESALARAERDDPRRTAMIEDAKAALQQARNAVLARIPEVRKEQEEDQKAQAEVQKMVDRRRTLDARAANLNRSLRDSSDPPIAAARKKLEDVREAIRSAENTEEMAAANKKVEAAQMAVDAKVREMAQTDSAYQAAAAEIADIDTQLATLDKGLPAATKGN